MASPILQRLTPEDGPRLRAIRLRALADTPDAFGSTLAAEAELSPDAWRESLAREDRMTLMAVLETTDVGMIHGAPWSGRAGVAGLFGMWVAPEARRRGVGAALVDAHVAWAREGGFERVILGVGDWNTGAIAFYRSRGFRRNGVVDTLPPPRVHITEHERELRLC
mgnify:CR=1 FL=1